MITEASCINYLTQLINCTDEHTKGLNACWVCDAIGLTYIKPCYKRSMYNYIQLG